MSTSDLQLARLGLKPVKDLPTREGSKFIVTLRDMTERLCHIRARGIVTPGGAGFLSSEVIGWKPAP